MEPPRRQSAASSSAASQTSLKSAQTRGDHEFLAAALEILDSPPSPVRMWILATICAFVVVALGWSWIGRLDIIATAPGKVHPSGRIKIIQPLDAGKVAAIHVENGQRVPKGDLLIKLDRSETQADVAANQAALDSYDAERARRLAALSAAQARRLTPTPSLVGRSDLPTSIRHREERVLAADLGELASSVASLQAQAEQKSVEQTSLRATIEVQKQLVATDRTRVQMKTELFNKDAGSKADVVNATETLQYQQTTLVQDQGQIVQSQAAQRVIERDIQKTYETFVSDNAQKLDDAERQADDVRQKLVKARAQLDHASLRSPIDGVVQGLTVTTIGQVLGAGEEILRIVPNSPDLDIEAYLPNEDRGFVKDGDEAIVKVATFPFTRYGTLPARVVRVARDAIPQPDAMQAEADPTRPAKDASVGGGQPTQNLVYPVTLQFERTTMTIDGAPVSVSPGMSVTVEIRTGSRRILQYLFSPLVQTTSEAMKER